MFESSVWSDSKAIVKCWEKYLGVEGESVFLFHLILNSEYIESYVTVILTTRVYAPLVNENYTNQEYNSFTVSITCLT